MKSSNARLPVVGALGCEGGLANVGLDAAANILDAALVDAGTGAVTGVAPPCERDGGRLNIGREDEGAAVRRLAVGAFGGETRRAGKISWYSSCLIDTVS